MYNEAYRRLLEVLNTGESAAMLTRLQGDAPNRGTRVTKTVIDRIGLSGSEPLEDSVREAAEEALQNGVLCRPGDDLKDRWLMEPSFPEPRLVILGGGHIAKPLAEFGAKLGFRITVVDDRITFANPSRFPDAERVICESFDRCFPQLELNRSCYVVIVTRGHRHDMDCYRQVLNYETAYTGMIGSKRRIRALLDQFAEEGIPAERLDQLHAPIGIDIGGVTPEEIALSIMAEVVRCRRLGNGSSGKRNSGSPELDLAVLNELANGPVEPKALVTVIGTKG